MPSKPLHPCSYPGCSILTKERFCDKHKKDEVKRYDKQRGTAVQRGYDARWQRYRRQYLRRPENVLCKLRLPGCTRLAECIDHIDPPNGPDDPRFWDINNHQPACIHCNSVKGHRKMIGKD